MGDVILAVNGKEVEDSDHLGELVNAAQGPVLLTVKREEVRRTVEVQPETDQPGGERRLGVWTRDSTSGVGTVTFYDPASGVFGALGHVISDVDTQRRCRCAWASWWGRTFWGSPGASGARPAS